jgi:hypothetical protein
MAKVNPRQAIYDAMGFQPDQQKRFEKQLKGELPKLRELFQIDTSLPPEQAKTAVLAAYQKGEEERKAKQQKRVEAVGTYSDQFKRTFGVPLQRFMHPMFGFDSVNFDTQVVQSGDRSCAEVVKERYGESAVNMLIALLG